jgi:hypothetical protein
MTIKAGRTIIPITPDGTVMLTLPPLVVVVEGVLALVVVDVVVVLDEVVVVDEGVGIGVEVGEIRAESVVEAGFPNESVREPAEPVAPGS